MALNSLSQMGIYAGFGVGQAISMFCMGACFALLTYFASQTLHKVLVHVLRFVVPGAKPFDVGCHQAGHACANVFLRDHCTLKRSKIIGGVADPLFYKPLGRIMNRFSKDIDTVDNLLGDALRMFTATFANILGAVILISIVLPWFLIGVVAIAVLYVWGAAFYRASARELKVCPNRLS